MRYLQRDENLVLILQDFGEGFDLEAAFEKGTMGLDSIRTRAQLIGAECFIKTRRFEGCKIEITLPIEDWNFEDNETQNVPVAYQNNTPTPKKRLSNEIKHILIVDNQPEYGEFLQKLIQDTFLGIKVEYKKSAQEAHNYLQNIDYQCDVVITDITMPYESGIKMIKKLKKIEAANDIEFIIYSINDAPLQYTIIAESIFSDSGRQGRTCNSLQNRMSATCGISSGASETNDCSAITFK